MSELLSILIVSFQGLSLLGIWFDVFGPDSREKKPPLSSIVLLLAILSGTSYFLAGVTASVPDWVKITIGAASFVTCATNLVQYRIGRLAPQVVVSLVTLELLLLGLLATAAISMRTLVAAVLVKLPIVFAFSQSGGRIVQIRRFWYFEPKKASRLVWISNVMLNITLIFYHYGREERLWMWANSVSLFFGLIVLFQVLRFRYRGSRKTTVITKKRCRFSSPECPVN